MLFVLSSYCFCSLCSDSKGFWRKIFSKKYSSLPQKVVILYNFHFGSQSVFCCNLHAKRCLICCSTMFCVKNRRQTPLQKSFLTQISVRNIQKKFLTCNALAGKFSANRLFEKCYTLLFGEIFTQDVHHFCHGSLGCHIVTAHNTDVLKL